MFYTVFVVFFTEVSHSSSLVIAPTATLKLLSSVRHFEFLNRFPDLLKQPQVCLKSFRYFPHAWGVQQQQQQQQQQQHHLTPAQLHVVLSHLHWRYLLYQCNATSPTTLTVLQSLLLCLSVGLKSWRYCAHYVYDDPLLIGK
jgi:hypothetical protein